MATLTDFADQAVVLPMVLTVALMLAVLGWPRGALAWLAAVLGTFGVMLGLKLLFAACGEAFPGLAIHSPSGHTAAAAIIYGGLAALLGLPPALALAVSAGVAILFGASRVALGVHTLPDVLVGALVGLGGVAALIRLAGAPPPRLSKALLLAPLVVVLVLSYGAHLHAEAAIDRLGRLLETWPFSACRAA